MNGLFQFRWLGVAGVELRYEDTLLMIDPYFTRFPLWRSLFGCVQPDAALVEDYAPRADYLLVTHSHFDHLLDVPPIVERTGALALGSANTCRLLRVLGAPKECVQQVYPGEALALGPFQVQVIAGELMPIPFYGVGPLPVNLSPPLAARHYRIDHFYSYRISVSGVNLLTDPGVNPEQATPAEVLLVNPLQGVDFYEALLGQVQPQLVIIIHWDDFFRPLTKPLRPTLRPPKLAWPPTQRVDMAQIHTCIQGLAPGAGVLTPEIFRAYDLDPSANS